MNIGKLDRLVTIQKSTMTRDSNGEFTTTWSTLSDVWATVSYPTNAQGMDESLEQGRETATIPVEFTIWYLSTVKETMRVQFESEYFEIKRVNRVGQRNEMLKLVTEKKV